jgi:hypothetical protein
VAGPAACTAAALKQSDHIYFFMPDMSAITNVPLQVLGSNLFINLHRYCYTLKGICIGHALQAGEEATCS